MPSTNESIKVFKKRGMLHGGYIATLAVDSLFNGMELARRSVFTQHHAPSSLPRLTWPWLEWQTIRPPGLA
jgi:hypothetical protein